MVAIDNDEVLLLMLKEMYAQEGIHCDTCTNAAELMELIRKKEYSLLLTDLNMPDINGFELLELLRTSNVGNSRDIPVIVTTASGSCGKEDYDIKNHNPRRKSSSCSSETSPMANSFSASLRMRESH